MGRCEFPAEVLGTVLLVMMLLAVMLPTPYAPAWAENVVNASNSVSTTTVTVTTTEFLTCSPYTITVTKFAVTTKTVTVMASNDVTRLLAAITLALLIVIVLLALLLTYKRARK